MTVTLRVLSTHAAMDVLDDLKPRFERATGVRLSLGYDPSKAVKRYLENGGACDVAIVTRPVFDALAQQGMMHADTRADVGRCGLGVAVRAGAPVPDVSTPDAFKRALLAAKSVVRSTDGASGQHFELLIERLGIAKAMRGKIVMGKSGRIAELVARGEGELAVQQIPELLPVEGTTFAGPLPAEFQLYSTFCAGVTTSCQHREAAEAIVAAITTAEAAKLFAAAGLEPVPA
ncbi:MAG: substrate-binding domain-containing protein [Pseudolabrys sp.]|nr:substrate-binding domain-containing protein [Pseudolabrys sp.]